MFGVWLPSPVYRGGDVLAEELDTADSLTDLPEVHLVGDSRSSQANGQC